MSIIRLSCLKSRLFAPHADGSFIDDAYNARRRPPAGRMEAVEPANLLPADSLLGRYVDHMLEREAPSLAPGTPVVVMVHGFLFDPRQAVTVEPQDSDNPHSRLYHFGFDPSDTAERDEWRYHTSSWPVGLGIAADDGGASGLAVGFGWHSQPGFASSILEVGKNFYARANDYATQSSWPLVNLLLALTERIEDRPIDLFVHSLGTRVTLRALAKAAKIALGRELGERPDDIDRLRAMFRHLGRIVLMGGSEYVVEAQIFNERLLALAARDRWDASVGPFIYNFGSRENDVLDVLAENFGPRTFGNSQVIGHNGLETGDRSTRWMDLRIDGWPLRHWMEEFSTQANPIGFMISGDREGNIWDHWYYFTYRNNMSVYRSILRERANWTFQALRAGQGHANGDPVAEGF
jgi:pimeloyl-ACP methyl ester carboxylesterase